jgi:ABC-type transport system substrate-binding protein
MSRQRTVPATSRWVVARQRDGVAPRLLALTTMVLALSLSACGSGDSAKGGQGAKPKALTVQFFGAPLGLSPASGAAGSSLIYNLLAYDPLIHMTSDGKFEPDLATKWGYEGSDNTVFDLTLREGVKFSDGAPLSAAGVKTWLEFFRDAQGTESESLADLKEVEVKDPLNVTLRFSAPTPGLERTLSQNGVAGLVASPKALKTPKSLDTKTFGAGQYVYSPRQSVFGQSMTYVRNTSYWNPEAIHYASVTVKAMPDPNAVLAASRSGQIDVALSGTTNLAKSAKDAGLNIVAAPYTWDGLLLMDRGGEHNKALGDVKVRQAINYAIDREALAKALGYGYAKATSNIMSPGTDGYLAELDNYYPYDPEKAKALLAEAGYANGAEVDAVAPGYDPPGVQLLEAVADQLKAVGIKMKLSTPATYEQLDTIVRGHKASIVNATVLVAAPMQQFARAAVAPHGGYNNFESRNPAAEALLAQGNALGDRDAAKAKYQEIARLLVEEAWFAPVFIKDATYYVSPKVAGVHLSEANNLPNPVSPNPADGWQPSGN